MYNVRVIGRSKTSQKTAARQLQPLARRVFDHPAEDHGNVQVRQITPQGPFARRWMGESEIGPSR
jgi:hypothetical protein